MPSGKQVSPTTSYGPAGAPVPGSSFAPQHPGQRSRPDVGVGGVALSVDVAAQPGSHRPGVCSWLGQATSVRYSYDSVGRAPVLGSQPVPECRLTWSAPMSMPSLDMLVSPVRRAAEARDRKMQSSETTADGCTARAPHAERLIVCDRATRRLCQSSATTSLEGFRGSVETTLPVVIDDVALLLNGVELTTWYRPVSALDRATLTRRGDGGRRRSAASSRLGPFAVVKARGAALAGWLCP